MAEVITDLCGAKSTAAGGCSSLAADNKRRWRYVESERKRGFENLA